MFCTLALRSGRLLDANRQLGRLASSAKTIGLSVPAAVRGPDGLCAVLRELGVDGSSDAVVRVQVNAGVSGRGYARGDSESWELVELLPEPSTRTLTIAVLPESESILSPLPAVKSCSALPHVLCASAAARLGVAEAVRTTRGALLEASASNLFWAGDRTLFTPSAELPLYPGATREVVIEVAREAGWKVEEGRFDAQSLKAARAAFLTNATRGVEPVAFVDGVAVAWPEELAALRSSVERHRDERGIPVAVP